MQFIDFFFAHAGAWAWVIAGLVLLGLEIFVSGGVLLWMGISGIVTGGVVLVYPITTPLQWLMFGVLSLATVMVWLCWLRGWFAASDRPYLNRRAEQYIGQEALLGQPIQQGFGRISLGDSVWRVSGPDLPAGQRVRIVGANGTVLRVEPVHR